PRPFASRCTTRTSPSSAASSSATASVASVLALSATVIRAGNGNPLPRYWCRRRTQTPRSVSSLYTGTTTSSTGGDDGPSTWSAGPATVTVSVISTRFDRRAGSGLRATCEVAVWSEALRASRVGPYQPLIFTPPLRSAAPDQGRAPPWVAERVEPVPTAVEALAVLL